MSHSQGSPLVFMMLATDRLSSTYNDKIAVHIAMGPVTYGNLMTSKLLGGFCKEANVSNTKCFFFVLIALELAPVLLDIAPLKIVFCHLKA